MSSAGAEEGRVALACVLARVADQLQRTSGRLLQAEEAVARVVLGRIAPGAQEIAELQAVDLALQELAGISGFLAKLSQATPEHWTADLGEAQATLGLESLAAALGGGASFSGQQQDCELF